MRATLVAVTLCLCVMTSRAATVNVPTDFPTIQEGIDSASHGDTVLIEAGIYGGEGNCNLVSAGKTLTILGQYVSDSVRIVCGDTAKGFAQVAGNVTIKNIVIENPTTAIYMSTTSDSTVVLVEECRAYNCANYGTYLYFWHHMSVEFSDCYFEGGQKGIYVDGRKGGVTATGCTFDGCETGLYINNNAVENMDDTLVFTVVGCDFINNEHVIDNDINHVYHEYAASGVLNYCSFLGTSGYVVLLHPCRNTKPIIDARNNWWGTSDGYVPALKVYDHLDDVRLPMVDCSAPLDAPYPGGVPQTEYVSFHFTSDTTLNASDSPYRVNGYYGVSSNAKLTLEPGTALYFGPSTILSVYGELESVGNATTPVLLTSGADTAGGSPVGGGWSGLRFRDNSTGLLRHTEVRYPSNCIVSEPRSNTSGLNLSVDSCLLTGFGSHGAHFWFRDSVSVEFSNTRFEHGIAGIYADGQMGQVLVDRCVFDSCEKGIHLYGNSAQSGEENMGFEVILSDFISNQHSIFLNTSNALRYYIPVGTVSYCSFSAYSDYAFYAGSCRNDWATIDATNCWWGHEDSVAIASNAIYDQTDFISSATVQFVPFIRSGDIALPTAIVSPSSLLERGSVVIPEVKVRSNSQVNQTIPVVLEIGRGGSVYRDSMDAYLGPLDSTQLSFSPWAVDTVGSFTLTVWTDVEEDEYHGNDTLRAVVAVVGDLADPYITGITPQSHGNAGCPTLTIVGGNFETGAEVRLEKSGEDAVIASSLLTDILGVDSISVSVCLLDQTPGQWDVVVENSPGSACRYDASFDIQEAVDDLWVDIVGPDRIRVRRWTSYLVSYGNDGNIDAESGVLALYLPAHSHYRIIDEEGSPLESGYTSLESGNGVTINGCQALQSSHQTMRLDLMPMSTSVSSEVGAALFRGGEFIWPPRSMSENESSGAMRSISSGSHIHWSTQQYSASGDELGYTVPWDKSDDRGLGYFHNLLIYKKDGDKVEKWPEVAIKTVGGQCPHGKVCYMIPWHNPDQEDPEQRSVIHEIDLDMFEKVDIPGLPGNMRRCPDCPDGLDEWEFWDIGGYAPWPGFSENDWSEVRSAIDYWHDKKIGVFCEHETSENSWHEPECLSCVGAGVRIYDRAFLLNPDPYPPSRSIWFYELRQYSIAQGMLGRFEGSTSIINWYVEEYVNLQLTLSHLDGMMQRLAPAFEILDEMTYRSTILVGAPSDPNDKHGPVGFGQSGFVTPGRRMQYMIMFENVDTAMFEAENIVIADSLSPHLDWRTLEFGPVHPGNGPDSIRPDFEVTTEFDSIAGVITWSLTGINLPPDTAVLMPDSTEEYWGEGWLTYSVNSKSDLVNGTRIENIAAIKFDEEDWILAPMDSIPIFNTIDADPPSSHVYWDAWRKSPDSASVLMRWTGEDSSGSGVRDYTIYYRMGESGDTLVWLENTTADSGFFRGMYDSVYSFYSIATDNVGNVEAKPDSFDIQLDLQFYCGDVNNNGHPEADVSDIVYLVDFIFLGGLPAPLPDAANMDCSGEPLEPDISDLVRLINHVFSIPPNLPLDCPPCDDLLAKQRVTNEGGSCNIPIESLSDSCYKLLVGGDFAVEIAGIQQRYGFDSSVVRIDSIVAGKDGGRVGFFSHIEDEKITLGFVDTRGRQSFKAGEAELATIYFHKTDDGLLEKEHFSHDFTKAADRSGNPVTLSVNSVSGPAVPKAYALHQNYPNPFNAATVIKYDLPKTSDVRVDVYNILGQRVVTLVDGQQDAGFHEVFWNSSNADGGTVASGVYFYRIQAEDFTQSKKMVLLK